MGEPSLRRACDRCHGQKLSCQRHGNESCARCIRANKPCTTSPSLRNKKNRDAIEPKTSANERHLARRRTLSTDHGLRQQAEDREIVNVAPIDALLSLDDSQGLQMQSTFDAMQWDGRVEVPTIFNSGNASSEDISTVHRHSTSTLNYWPGPDTPNDFDIDMDSVDFSDFGLASPTAAGAPDSAAEMCWKAIAPTLPMGFNRDIVETAIAAQSTGRGLPLQPPLQTSGSTTIDPIEDGQWLSTLTQLNVKLYSQARKTMAVQNNATDRSLPASSVVLDEALGLFFQFLGLLREYRSAVDPSPSSSSSNTCSSTGTSISDGLGTDAPPSSFMSMATDPGSILVMLSCYIRILETCTKALAVIKAALAAGSSASLRRMPLFDLAVGSNALDSQYPLIRLRMLMELMESLLECMRVLLAPNRGAGGGGRQDSEDSIKASWDRFMYRQPQITQQAVHSLEEKAFDMIRAIRIDLRKFQGDGEV